MKKIKVIVTTIVALAVVLLIAVLGLPASFLLDTIQSRFEAETGYRMQAAGGASISFWPSPTVAIRDVVVFERGKNQSSGSFKAESLNIRLSFAGLLNGRPQITELAIHRPQISIALARERTQPAASKTAPAPTEQPSIPTVKITEGSLVFQDRNRVEGRLEGIDVEATRSTDGQLSVKGSARWQDQLIRLGLTADAAPARLDARMIPIEVTFEAPGLLAAPLGFAADVAMRTASLNINGVTGKAGTHSFNGWAVVDFAAGKPLLKGDFDFSRLDLRLGDGPKARPGSAAGEPWSRQEISLDGLNFFDAEVKVSAAELNVDTFKFAPLNVEVQIGAGSLLATLSQTEAYGGQVNGSIAVTASDATPAHEMRIELAGVSALALLSDLGDFRWVDGRMHARVDVQAAGASQHAIMSTLGGTVDVRLDEAAIQGLDLPRLIRSLAASTQLGWQTEGSAKTDLAEARALFRISKGVAVTDNLLLVGPFVQVTGTGSADLSAKTLNFKVAPRLLAGQSSAGGGRPEAVGLGVPVIVEGDWSAPSIHLDVPGILENPQAAYDQLRALGEGLFGGLGKPGVPPSIPGVPPGLPGIPGKSDPATDNLVDSLIQGLGGFLKQLPKK